MCREQIYPSLRYKIPYAMYSDRLYILKSHPHISNFNSLVWHQHVWIDDNNGITFSFRQSHYLEVVLLGFILFFYIFFFFLEMCDLSIYFHPFWSDETEFVCFCAKHSTLLYLSNCITAWKFFSQLNIWVIRNKYSCNIYNLFALEVRQVRKLFFSASDFLNSKLYWNIYEKVLLFMFYSVV